MGGKIEKMFFKNIAKVQGRNASLVTGECSVFTGMKRLRSYLSMFVDII